MTKKNSLAEALQDELKDLYSAENQILTALPKMVKKASTESLKNAFQSHLEETQGHVERLEKIGKILEFKLSGKVCKGMKGLLEEGKEILEEESDNPAVIDALLIGGAQRVEHYEMAVYGTTRAMSEELGYSDVAQLLQETLDEEGAADKKLSAIAEGEVLSEANTGEESGTRLKMPISQKKKSGVSRNSVNRNL